MVSMVPTGSSRDPEDIPPAAMSAAAPATAFVRGAPTARAISPATANLRTMGASVPSAAGNGITYRLLTNGRPSPALAGANAAAAYAQVRGDSMTFAMQSVPHFRKQPGVARTHGNHRFTGSPPLPTGAGPTSRDEKRTCPWGVRTARRKTVLS